MPESQAKETPTLFAVPVLTRSIHEDGSSDLFEEKIFVVEACNTDEAAEAAQQLAIVESPEYEVADGSKVRWELWMTAEPRPMAEDLVSGAEIYSRRMRESDASKWWNLWNCWRADEPDVIKPLDGI
jgi:hypothetical protein